MTGKKRSQSAKEPTPETPAQPAPDPDDLAAIGQAIAEAEAETPPAPPASEPSAPPQAMSARVQRAHGGNG